MTKHKRSRIGLTKGLKITTDSDNTFRVYGDSIGSANPVKQVKIKGNKHDWDDPSSITDIDANTLELKALCHKRHSKGTYGDDDVTVTITLDPGTTGEDITNCTFPDVEHDD